MDGINFAAPTAQSHLSHAVCDSNLEHQMSNAGQPAARSVMGYGPASYLLVNSVTESPVKLATQTWLPSEVMAVGPLNP